MAPNWGHLVQLTEHHFFGCLETVESVPVLLVSAGAVVVVSDGVVVVPVAAGVVSTVVDGAGVTVVSAGGVTVTEVDGAGVGSTTTGRSSFFLQAVSAKAMPRVAMSAVVFIHELS